MVNSRLYGVEGFQGKRILAYREEIANDVSATAK
jgi:hypothetical protein